MHGGEQRSERPRLVLSPSPCRNYPPLFFALSPPCSHPPPRCVDLILPPSLLFVSNIRHGRRPRALNERNPFHHQSKGSFASHETGKAIATSPSRTKTNTTAIVTNDETTLVRSGSRQAQSHPRSTSTGLRIAAASARRPPLARCAALRTVLIHIPRPHQHMQDLPTRGRTPSCPRRDPVAIRAWISIMSRYFLTGTADRDIDRGPGRIQ